MERQPQKNGKILISTSNLLFCPYFKGLGISQPEDCSNPVIYGDRRAAENGQDTDSNPYKDRRWLKTEVCPLSGTNQCTHRKYPSLRSFPDLIATLCNSKAIMRMVDMTPVNSVNSTESF